MESGYAAASMLEIATRARVSKRELYTLVGDKQEMLIACISGRAKRFDVPADLPILSDRETLAEVLASFGTKVVREVSDPTVIAVFRLAISEVIHAPEVARALDSIARERSRATLRKIMAGAQASELLTGRPAELPNTISALTKMHFCSIQSNGLYTESDLNIVRSREWKLVELKNLRGPNLVKSDYPRVFRKRTIPHLSNLATCSFGMRSSDPSIKSERHFR